MRTNIELEDKKIADVMAFGIYKTKKEAVNEAMNLHIRFLMLQQFDKMRGPGFWVGNLDEMRTYDKWDDNI